MLIRLLGLLLLGTLATAQDQNSTICATDRWGPGCQNVCGDCKTSTTETRKCDRTSGKCSECTEGYVGEFCDEAICESGCGEGICIAPGLCANCGDINKVAPNCADIRFRGLIGSAIAFAVILSSVTFCGLGSVWYKRRSNSAVAL